MADDVKSGAALLDQYFPDWWKQVNLKKLSMTSMQTCVLGQLYGGYFEGLTALGLCSGLKHGFDTFGDLGDLVKAWKSQVLDRKFADV